MKKIMSLALAVLLDCILAYVAAGPLKKAVR